MIVGDDVPSAGAVPAVRDGGYCGDLLVVGREHHHPYERPSLSKDHLRREINRAEAFTLRANWCAEHSVEVQTRNPSSWTLLLTEWPSKGATR